MLQQVLSMLREGYNVKEICINDDIFGGKEIDDIEIYTDYICIKLIYDEIIFAQISKIDWIILVE